MVQVTLKNNKTVECVTTTYTARELVSHGGEDLLMENIIENNICNCTPVGETYVTDCNCFEDWDDCSLFFGDED